MLPIILAINNDEERNFVEEIYTQYGKRIYMVALNILKHSEDAEDCLQDVIRIIIDHLEIFRAMDREGLIKLLVTCTRNAALDIYRKNKIKYFYEEKTKRYSDDEMESDNGRMENIPDEEALADSILISSENQKRIAAMIEELEPIYRDILFLRYRYAMKNQEIAKILNISENAVKVRYHRARKILLEKRGRELDEMRKNG